MRDVQDCLPAGPEPSIATPPADHDTPATDGQARRMTTVAAKGLVRRPPSEGMIADWIVEAGTLGRTIEY